MSFLRHGEIYRSDESYSGRGRNATHCQSAPRPGRQARRKMRASLIVHDEFPVGYSSAGCSPAEPASASPTAPSMRWADSTGNRMPANGNLSLISVPQQRGSVHTIARRRSPFSAFPSFLCGRIGLHLLQPLGRNCERQADEIGTPLGIVRTVRRGRNATPLSRIALDGEFLPVSTPTEPS